MEDSSKPKAKSHHYTDVRRKKPLIEQKALSHDLEKETQSSVEMIADQEQGKQQGTQSQYPSGMIWLFLPISGILGGLIALGLWIGIQWAGFLPFSFMGNSIGEEKALQLAEEAKIQVEEKIEQLNRALQDIDSLKEQFSSLSSQNIKATQGDEASQEENKKAFSDLEKKVSGIEESVQTLTEVLSKDIKTVLSIAQKNTDGFTSLKQQLETVKEEIAIGKNDKKEETNTALLIAINSLQSAIERGGSYAKELKILQQFSPSVDGIDLLQETAAIGLPNQAQLSADFANVADAIVGTQNIVASDAHFFERVFAWMKGLIISRPVGNVKGMTLGAIAARMEVAIQKGDYEKALAEWQTLPESAKDVSIDFIHQLERSIAVHNFLQKLLIFAQQRSFEATKM
ncbi:COG4223 family protein [Bartonella sp. CB189]|uniref:COG4223 family protein n=1 Tax=Bartonella sp. CB189 TaxID=3112254 RepID=UPI002F96AA5F